MNLPGFLTQDADGYIHLSGHRIGLDDVIYYFKEGYSPEKLLEQFPSLSLRLIEDVISFYLKNRESMDSYVAECRAEIERQRASSPRVLDWEELQRRMEAMGRLEKQ
jgi:uncharacterized protein (DUF433 family)